MTCRDLSKVVIFSVVGITIVLGILTIVAWIAKLNEEQELPVECIDGKAYEITIKGNVKYFDEIVDTKCEVLK